METQSILWCLGMWLDGQLQVTMAVSQAHMSTIIYISDMRLLELCERLVTVLAASKLVTMLAWELMSTHAEIVSIVMMG